MYACNGILFNHESPLRGETFVTRKITRAVAQLALGLTNKLYMGNIDAKRDWGHAKDYVEAIWLMLQQSNPEDYVIATGECHSVREMLSTAFESVNLNWEKYVKIDKELFRPSEVHELKGNYSKAKRNLLWEPKMKFKELIKIMVEADLASLSNTVKIMSVT